MSSYAASGLNPAAIKVQDGKPGYFRSNDVLVDTEDHMNVEVPVETLAWHGYTVLLVQLREEASGQQSTHAPKPMQS